MEDNVTKITWNEFILNLIKQHSQDVVVNEEEFLDLLQNSLSLNLSEKKRVIDAVPTLSQFQFDELKKVFLEEREKFRELAQEHPEDIKKLYEKQKTEWISLWNLYIWEEENKKELEQIKSNTISDYEKQQEIDDIKKSLWL